MAEWWAKAWPRHPELISKLKGANTAAGTEASLAA
jgi:hypothetical protein